MNYRLLNLRTRTNFVNRVERSAFLREELWAHLGREVCPCRYLSLREGVELIWAYCLANSITVLGISISNKTS